MKICISFVDEERNSAEMILASIKRLASLRFVIKETPERDGYRHIYLKTPHVYPCKNA